MIILKSFEKNEKGLKKESENIISLLKKRKRE